MSRTFKELANHVNTLLGTQGTILDVTEPTSYQAEITTALNDGYRELQIYRDWKWRRKVATFDTVTDQVRYNPYLSTVVVDLDFAKWDRDMILYDRDPITEYDYDYFIQKEYDLSDSSSPSKYTIDPADKTLMLNPPDQAYEIEAYYYREPHQLELNTDTPICPPEFDILLVYKAVEIVAFFMGDGSKSARYGIEYNKILGQMLREENPKKTMYRRPLA